MASYKYVTSFGSTAAILFSMYAYNAKGTTAFGKLCVWNGLKKKQTEQRAHMATRKLKQNGYQQVVCMISTRPEKRACRLAQRNVK